MCDIAMQGRHTQKPLYHHITSHHVAAYAPYLTHGSITHCAGRSSGSSNGSERKLEGGETSDKFIVTVSARVPKSWMDAKKTGTSPSVRH